MMNGPWGAGPRRDSSTPREATPTSEAGLLPLEELDEYFTPVVKVELISRPTPYTHLLHGHFFEDQKDKLTRWWLHLIETSVDSFLRSLGYDFEAVPFHYIDHPPRSMPVILKNLQMIRFLLKASGRNLDSASLPMRRHIQDGLVDPLKRVIYTRIDSYAHSVMLFLWHECNCQLGVHLVHAYGQSPFAASALTPSAVAHGSDRKDKRRGEAVSGSGEDGEGVLVPRADLAFVRERLQQTNTIPEGRKKVLLSLLGDIHYIDEMKRLEQDFFAAPEDLLTSAVPPKKEAPSDIVPVTGLIVGKLHRLENELKTVVEHWSRRGL